MKSKSAADEPRTDNRLYEGRIRGACPVCGDVLVSNCCYIDGKGYLIVWECRGSLRDKPTCTHRRVL